jgi:hypothetical protein
MSEPEKRDHWAELADSMGVQPPPEEVKTEPTAPLSTQAETGPRVEARPPAVAPQRRAEPRPRADWAQLAANLGIAPAPAPPPRAVEPVAPQPVRFEPALPESPPRRARVEIESEIDSEAVAEARMRAEAWESQLVEVSDPVFVDRVEETEDMEAAESVQGDEDMEAAASVEGAEAAPREPAGEAQRGPRRRRRKKRHKRRPIEGAEGRSESMPTDVEPAEEDQEEILGESVDQPGDEAPAEAGETTGPESPAEAERREGRKRRRRRRKKRPEGAIPGEQSQVSEPEGEFSAEPLDEEHEEDEGLHDTEHEDDEELHDAEHEGADESSGKLSHRAIPTWDQAIGLIIARNMEARAKNPNGGQRRGGRGRQRGR